MPHRSRRLELLGNAFAMAAGVLGAAMMLRRLHRLELSGKVVVITGGGRGLGLAIARAFAERGCRIAICGRDSDVIQQAVTALRAVGVDVLGADCDASDPVAAEKFIGQVLEYFGALDVLVNNAGQCFVGPAVQLRPDDIEYAIRHIFWVHYYPTMAVLPHMRQRQAGSIVNITSVGGKMPLPHQAAYTVGKYAATGWSETLTTELAHEGIRVSTITPPPLRDGAPLHVHFNGDVEEEFRWFTKTLTSPLTATSAERTARAVVGAVEYGDPERAVTLSCWLAIRGYGLVPSLVSRCLSFVASRLPCSGAPGRTSPMVLGMQVLAATGDRRVQELGRVARRDAERHRPKDANELPTVVEVREPTTVVH